MPFRDRTAAGEALADHLLAQDIDVDLVLAIPRGGIAVAAPVARALGAELDVLVARKIGVPGQAELAAGAVTRLGVTWNADVLALLGATPADFTSSLTQARAELDARTAAFRAVRTPAPVAGRRVMIVDDGLATGATVAAAVGAVQAGGAASVVVAVPVASEEAVARLERLGASVIALRTPWDLVAVGAAYADFRPVSEAEAVAALRSAGNTAR